jgi:hypothetical protein
MSTTHKRDSKQWEAEVTNQSNEVVNGVSFVTPGALIKANDVGEPRSNKLRYSVGSRSNSVACLGMMRAPHSSSSSKLPAKRIDRRRWNG